jgi:hypothetical protein
VKSRIVDGARALEVTTLLPSFGLMDERSSVLCYFPCFCNPTTRVTHYYSRHVGSVAVTRLARFCPAMLLGVPLVGKSRWIEVALVQRVTLFPADLVYDIGST